MGALPLESLEPFSPRGQVLVRHRWLSIARKSAASVERYSFAMSQENVEAIRTVFDQFARGDFGRWFALTTDDFEFVTSPDIPDAGTYYGEEARRWITAWVRSFEGHTMEATEITDAGGDRVFAGFVQRGHPRGSQSAVEGRWWLVATFRHGAIARIEVFDDRVEALKATGLSE